MLKKFGTAASAAALFVSLRAAAAPVVLKGHVPKQLRGAVRLERAPADENVELSLVVRLDPSLLDQTLSQLYGANAPWNKRFLSSAEFVQRFDLAHKRQALKDFAAGAGLALAEDRPGSLVVKVSGASGVVERAFGVQLHHYRSADGQVFRANDSDPSVPGELAPHLNAVLGLSNFRGVKKPRSIRGHPPSPRSSGSGAGIPSAVTGTGPQGGLAPADIKTIYGLSGTLNGSGQTVALLELDGYAAADIGLYETQFGLASPTVTCTSADGSCGVCGANQNSTCDAATLASDGGMVEVALDIDMMIALAPGVSKILVYTALNTDAGLLTAYADAANDNTAKVMSTSWGEDVEDAYDGSSSFMTSESQIFAQMAAQGQTIVSAAGDAGAYDSSGNNTCGAHGNQACAWNGALLTDDPASQPYVTGVGGTSLSGTIGGAISETVWNGGCSSGSNPGVNCAANGAGGGGVANYVGGSTTYWPLPSYQSGVAGAYSTTNRNVPDVALNADPNAAPYSICVGGSCNQCNQTSCTTLIGGTSAAAPLWAALTALVNQQRAAGGLGTLGFANTALYRLGTGGSRANYFNDITSGNNGFYSAGTGYDNASGWGSFKANALIAALALPPAPVVTSALTASGTVGAAFGYSITASNSPTSFSAANLPAGLGVNTSNGVISGTPTTAGTKSATISATNAGGTGSATLVFTINPPPPVITSALSASTAAGTAFSYTIAASNVPTSFSAANLPAGLSVNTSNGVISGTPGTPGTKSVTIGATNAGGTGTATLVLTINNPPVPAVTSALSATGTVGAAFSYAITASNSPTSYSAPGLPAGLSVNPANGAISGTPTAAGTTNVAIGASNAGGAGPTSTLGLTINPAAPSSPAITSALGASGTAGTAFSYAITASNSPTSYNASGLPAGLSVNTGNGVVSGTPTTPGTTDASISATNAAGTGTATIVFTIAPPAPVITSALSASGTAGGGFGYAITASNGPTSFSAAGLPAGLSVNTSNGVISGTPTTPGTVSAVNAGGTGTATLILTIAPAAPASPVITSALAAAAAVGVPFSYALAASNAPTSYNASGLPAGLSINTSNGAVAGTPTSAGTSSAVVSATNPSGTGAATLVFTVYLALSSGTVPSSGITLTLPQVFPQVNSMNVYVPPGAFPAGTAVSAGNESAALPAAVTNEAPSIVPFGTNLGLTLSADGLQPATPVTVTMAYDFTQIPAGQNESRLELWRYDPASLQWTLVPSHDDPVGHVLTAQTPHFSTFAPFFVAAGSDVNSVQVFPQPWEIGDSASQYWSSVLTLSGLPSAAMVKIFTIRGELVWSGTAAGSGVLTWDGNNRFGRRVASGTYYASFQSGGQTKTRRLVIIR